MAGWESQGRTQLMVASLIPGFVSGQGFCFGLNGRAIFTNGYRPLEAHGMMDRTDNEPFFNRPRSVRMTGNPSFGGEPMPVHDWTHVEAGIFHSFHNLWSAQLNNALNDGLLPQDYYALVEQHASRFVTDVLTLHASPPNGEPPPLPLSGGAIAVAEAPPKVRRKLTGPETYRQRRRTLAIRQVSGHRLVALLEIVSPANKDRPGTVGEFVAKVIEALDLRIHILLVDLLPPSRH